MNVYFGLNKQGGLAETCSQCGARVDPTFYKTVYHSFTGKYFCNDDCFSAAIEEVEAKRLAFYEEAKKVAAV